MVKDTSESVMINLPLKLIQRMEVFRKEGETNSEIVTKLVEIWLDACEGCDKHPRKVE